MESNVSITVMGLFTTLFSMVFFGCNRVLLFYMAFELTMFPLVLIIFFYGSQPEKIRSIYYALIYTGTLSMPFLYEIIKAEP